MTTANANIGTLQTTTVTHTTEIADLDTRVTAIEGATVPAVDTVQEDVKVLTVASRKRQENDPAELGKPQVVLRPSVERVRRPDGHYVQRTTRPR